MLYFLLLFCLAQSKPITELNIVSLNKSHVVFNWNTYKTNTYGLTDRIGLFQIGSRMLDYIPAIGSHGHFSLLTSGNYQLRYLIAKTNTSLISSRIFHIGLTTLKHVSKVQLDQAFHVSCFPIQKGTVCLQMGVGHPGCCSPIRFYAARIVPSFKCLPGGYNFYQIVVYSGTTIVVSEKFVRVYSSFTPIISNYNPTVSSSVQVVFPQGIPPYGWQLQELGSSTTALSGVQTEKAFGFILPTSAVPYVLTLSQNNKSIGVAEYIIQPRSIEVNCPVRPSTNIEHVVIIVPENQGFDTYFGKMCIAEQGSNPTCNVDDEYPGRTKCCEAPTKIPFINDLTDEHNLNYSLCLDSSYMQCAINGGKMDKFASGCEECDPELQKASLTIAEFGGPVVEYHKLAKQYAISDRYFHSLASSSCGNNMYMARTGFVFNDNDYSPLSPTLSSPWECEGVNATGPNPTQVLFDDPTIVSLLNACNVSWAFYAQGYRHRYEHSSNENECWPEYYDPGDCPFQYYRYAVDDQQHMKDYNDFFEDLSKGSLPKVSWIKPLGNTSEHPGHSTISAGVNFTMTAVNAVLNSSKYNKTTLIIIAPDEAGGHYDHISPTALDGSLRSSVDMKPYGIRVWNVFAGYFAKKQLCFTCSH